MLQAGARGEAVEVLREGVDAAERSGADMHDLRCAGLLVRALARLEPGRGWRELLRSTEAKLGAVHVPPGEVLLFAWDGAVGIAAAWLARVGREASPRDDRVDRRRVHGTVVAGGGRRRLSRPGDGAGRTR